MYNTRYKHCSMEGTFFVDCDILRVKDGKYEIKYYDNVIKETIVKFVDVNTLELPNFGDRVI